MIYIEVPLVFCYCQTQGLPRLLLYLDCSIILYLLYYQTRAAVMFPWSFFNLHKYSSERFFLVFVIFNVVNKSISLISFWMSATFGPG